MYMHTHMVIYSYIYISYCFATPATVFLSVWLVCENLDIRVQKMRLPFSGGQVVLPRIVQRGKWLRMKWSFLLGGCLRLWVGRFRASHVWSRAGRRGGLDKPTILLQTAIGMFKIEVGLAGDASIFASTRRVGKLGKPWGNSPTRLSPWYGDGRKAADLFSWVEGWIER